MKQKEISKISYQYKYKQTYRLNKTWKLIIFLKTKIQEETCQKRTLGTIATHDLKSIIGNITYEALDPNKIEV